MKNVAFIPLRGGSRSIPDKNIRPMGGMPLAYWSINAAKKCDFIDKVVISTDSNKIKKILSPFANKKVKFHDRAPATATDTASTESALLEYFETRPCDNIFLIQATSPLTSFLNLSEAFNLFREGDYDSMLSGVKQHSFYWEEKPGGGFEPLNYNFLKRPRRQEHKGHFVENGAFYIFKYENLIKHKNRLGGKIGLYEMPPYSLHELDEPDDWDVVEFFFKKSSIEKMDLKGIKLFATDIDGVWTDGGMLYDEVTGSEIKKFNTKDGMGVKLLRENNIQTAVITSEKTNIVLKRAKKLKIEHIYQEVKDKGEVIRKIQDELSVDPSQTAYIGDDINDLSVRPYVKYFFSPLDASPDVAKISDFVCSKRGGDGCFREVVDLILGLNCSLY